MMNNGKLESRPADEAQPESHPEERISATTATRTLTAAGFRITGSQRAAAHIEYECERQDVFGVSVRYMFLVFESAEVDAELVRARSEVARDSGASVVVVKKEGSSSALAWDDFLAALGGAVPTWRAMTAEFFDVIGVSGQNRSPDGSAEQPWRVYEDAVADALEFIFGRKSRRLGGHRRGSKVPDCVIATPDGAVLVVDTKASGSPFEVTYDELRPLKEYVANQRIRQTGSQPVNGAVLVADAFHQDEARLRQQSNEFFADTGVPLTFLTSLSLANAVKLLSTDIRMRNKLRWKRWLCVGGLAEDKIVIEEVRQATDETISRS